MLERPSRATVRAGLLMCACALVAAGCGGASDEGTPALSQDSPPGEGGRLTWAVADRAEGVDPLEADTRAEQLLSRQVNEPLTAMLEGPFDESRRVPGLVRGTRSSSDQTIWTLRLRSGVRFQDGTPFNSGAVRANAVRWQTTVAGRELLPDVVGVAAPLRLQVQFVLSEPDPSFPERLDSPRLGIVSPRALEPSSGNGAVLARPMKTGTGPFELFDRSRTSQLLARNTDWWGATGDPDLGPALEQIVFRTEPDPSLRLALLDAGDIQLADELGRSQADIARDDPLLSVLAGPRETWLGIERSVRGVDSAREIPSLASAWLTTVTVPD